MNNYFYVDVDDEITSVIGRLRHEGSEEVFLVVPKRAIIAQSLVNLKLLSKEAGKLRKKLIFVSPDAQTRKIAEKAGLSVKRYVAKPKETVKGEVENAIPSKKRALERWEEEAAKEELKKVISKPKSKPAAAKTTKIKAGVYSIPKAPVPASRPPASPLPPTPVSPVVLPEAEMASPVSAKPQVVNLKELAARRRAKISPLPVIRKKALNPAGLTTPAETRKTELVEEPPLKELLASDGGEAGPEIGPAEPESAPRPAVRPVRKPKIARVNPFKVKKIGKRAVAPSSPSAELALPATPVEAIPPQIVSSAPPAAPRTVAPAAPAEVSQPAEIPERLERETANLTLREKERLRDLWMEQKGIVRGKSFQENTQLDLNAKEAPKEELITQGGGIFQTTHRRVMGSGKVIDLRTAKSALAGTADLPAGRVPQKKGKEIILPLLNVKLLAIFVVGISVILIILAGIILPEANISLKPKSASDNLELKVWASGEVAQADLGQRIIPAKAAHFKVNVEKTFSATAEKEIKENSQGQATVYNNSSQPLSLKQNALLEDASGNKFYTTAPITVPAAKSGNADNSNSNTNSTGSVKAGSGSVSITAESSDKNFNLKAGDSLNIPGLADGDYAGQVTAEITQEIKKGESRTAKMVSQDDLDRAKNELVDLAKQNSPDQIKNNFPADTAQTVRSEDLVTEDVAFTSDKKAGQEGDSFNAQAAVTFFALAFSQDDLKKLAKDLVESDRENKNGTVKVNNYTLTDPQPLENKAEISANVDYQLISSVDPNEVRKAVLAKKKSEAESYLKGRSDVESFSLNIWPNLLGHMPVLERRINVEVQ